jgi:L-fuculose-phosphate aldolase
MDKRKELAKYGKLIHEKGLVIGAGGNISARDEEAMIIKKKGADMSDGDAAAYVRVLLEEAAGGSALSSSETPLHVACYKACRDVQAVVHVHSPMIIAAAEKTRLLESTSYEFDCILQKGVPVIEYLQPGSASLAEAVAERIADGASAVMMRRHGAVSVGKDTEEAYLRILALERSCVTFLHS